MKNYDSKNCKITDGFFAKRMQINAENSIPSVYLRFEETGRFKALKCKNEPPTSHIFWDSDVAKWLESAAYMLARKEDKQIRSWFNQAVEDMLANQLENGYFNSHFQVYEPDQIFKKRSDHELYCAGHIFEAAFAASAYLQDDRLLGFSEKYVDYIYQRFVANKDTDFICPGHEEIELALCKLYQLTGKEKYKLLAEFFLDNRGEKADLDSMMPIDAPYSQNHLPVRQQTKAVGHSVRALYLYTGMAEMAKIANDEGLKTACETLFNDIVAHKMYITGATGSVYQGERFSCDYDLPNDRAYAETCASIALCFFSHSMLKLTGEAKYGHAFERALYNGVLSGVSLDGECFFYVNPLEVSNALLRFNEAEKDWYRDHLPLNQRVKVFDCSCCPPNITRFIEQLPQYIWYADEENATITLSQHISSSLQSPIADVSLQSGFPTNGKLSLIVQSHGKAITLRVRKPEWCEKTFDNEKDGYLIYTGTFDNQTIEIDFPVTLKKVYANPMVSANVGKAALMYGPLVLCAEGVDNPFPVRAAILGSIKDAEISLAEDSRYAINVTLPVSVYETQTELYSYEAPKKSQKTLRLIPYFAWANRGATDMQVYFVNED